MYKPEHLTKWRDTGSYAGDDLSEWYILIAQTRDSFLLERENFKSIKAHIESKGFEIAGSVEEQEQNKVILLASFGHWACGWIEALMIHESNDKALELADEIKAQLNDYPIFNDDSYSMAESELQWDYVREYAVKDYLRDNDIDYDDSLLDKATNYILDHHNCEVNGYDEVLLPDNLDMDAIIDRIQHLTPCQTCGDEIDNRSESCSCQLSLLKD